MSESLRDKGKAATDRSQSPPRSRLDCREFRFPSLSLSVSLCLCVPLSVPPFVRPSVSLSVCLSVSEQSSPARSPSIRLGSADSSSHTNVSSLSAQCIYVSMSLYLPTYLCMHACMHVLYLSLFLVVCLSICLVSFLFFINLFFSTYGYVFVG